MDRIKWLMVLCPVVLAGGAAIADELMVYPSQGQDEAMQAADEEACSKWATSKTGFDPAISYQPAEEDAAADPDDAEESFVGDFKRSDLQLQRAEAQVSREQLRLQEYSDGINNYKRALAACLEARGYTVK